MNPLKLTSGVLPLATILVTAAYGNHALLFTQTPLAITTILYHQKILTSIRSVDILFCFLAGFHHIYISIDHPRIFSVYISSILIYLTGKLTEFHEHCLLSDYIHGLLHTVVFINTVVLNATV